MMKKVIGIRPESGAARPAAAAFAGGRLADTLGRPMRDLRISVTDRCNFRCVYCMPREVFDANYRFLPHSAILEKDPAYRRRAAGAQEPRAPGGNVVRAEN